MRQTLFAHTSNQMSGGAGVFNVGIPFQPDVGDAFIDWSVYALDGVPLAVFRERFPTIHGSEGACDQPAAAISGNQVALAFEEVPGTLVHGAYQVAFVVGPIGEIQRANAATLRIGLAQLASAGNGPDELMYDGTDLVMRTQLGSAYLGTFGGEPFAPIATCATDDELSGNGWLFDGRFFWASSPCGTPGWERIRRRSADGATNETLMERPDGHLDAFRTDGTWAVWLRDVDDAPPDGTIDRGEIEVARIDGNFQPSSWTSRAAARLSAEQAAFVSASRPTLVDGMYSYLDRSHRLEILDLPNDCKLDIDAPDGIEWQTLLYFGNGYVILETKDDAAWDYGLRRYHLPDLTGWTPLP